MSSSDDKRAERAGAAIRSAPVRAEPVRAVAAIPPAVGVRADHALVRVAIADKNPVVRAGLSDYIVRDGRFAIVDAVPSGHAFLSLCGDNEIDVGVIGWSLPDLTGGDVLGMLKRRHCPTRIIVYTGESGHDVLRQAVKAGAWGFISKADDPLLLLDTIATVSRGRLVLPYIDLQSLNEDPIETLTARERELLGALADGWSNMQIATRIGISRNTVKYHLKNLYDKLGVKNRAMAVGLFVGGGRDASTPREPERR